MCGIIGYIGPKNATSIAVEGLKKLEYRGYDSFGFAVKANLDMKIVKRVGKIGAVTLEELGLPASNIAVGHTRWATHGGVTEVNAHPHVSNDGKIVVVHNGIIENFREQKQFLESQGYKFQSETDTEVIPHTIAYHMKKGHNFVEACKHSLKHLDGQYALVVLHKDENKVVAIRKEAPLVIGVGEGEFFVASDVPAFLDYTKKVIFLNEMDMAVIDTAITIFNAKKDTYVERNITNIDWDAEQAKKGNFEHFFMKEVSE